MAFGLHVADHCFDGGAPSEFAFDEAEDAALLTRDEDAVRVLRVMPAISLVDIGALNCAAGEPFGVFDDGAEGVAVITKPCNLKSAKSLKTDSRSVA